MRGARFSAIACSISDQRRYHAAALGGSVRSAEPFG
jgi:hypothetical protein